MRLKTLRPRAEVREGGFSLLEAVVASGLLLATVTAVTFSVVALTHAGAGLERTMDADRALRSVAERLRALPFCAASYPQPGAVRGTGATDLLAAVFPHAREGRNTPTARYVAVLAGVGEPAGSFVSVISAEGGVQVRCVARFLAGPDGPYLDPGALVGWDIADASRPPAGAVAIVLDAEGVGRPLRLLRTALSGPAPEDGDG